MVSMLRKFLHLRKLRQGSPRHPVSYAVSQIFERTHIKKIFGAQLVAAIVVTGILSPETNLLFDKFLVFNKTGQTYLEAQPLTLSTFEMPLTHFKISQGFSFFHPGIDMSTALGNPIYALEQGYVVFAGDSFFGYGKHVILAHDHNMESLYGHMSEIAVKTGDHVDRGQFIGKVGSTGHSTGPHLHLEIRQNGILLNPLEILAIGTKDILTGAFTVASPSTTSAVTPTISPEPENQ